MAVSEIRLEIDDRGLNPCDMGLCTLYTALGNKCSNRHGAPGAPHAVYEHGAL